MVNSDRVRREEVNRFIPSSRGRTGCGHTAGNRCSRCPPIGFGHFAVSRNHAALVAFADVVVWKLKAYSALISLIDDKHQHILAQSTQSLLPESQDALRASTDVKLDCWQGRDDASKEEIPCGQTIELTAGTGEYTIHTVSDMKAHLLYTQLPFVFGPPFVRFYAGTPIRTAAGITVGTLFILDTKPRPCLNASQERLLGRMAETVMETLEVSQQAAICQRRTRMDRGLAAFLGEEQSPKSEQENVKRTDSQANGPPPGITSDVADPANRSSSSVETDTASGARVAEAGSGTREMNSQFQIFSRAARILHSSLHLGSGGGVVFLGNSKIIDQAAKSPVADLQTSGCPENKTTSGADTALILGSFRQLTTNFVDKNRPWHDFHFETMERQELKQLGKSYPHGKLWFSPIDSLPGTIGEEGNASRDNASPMENQHGQAGLKRLLFSILSRHFPQAQQLIYLPLPRVAPSLSNCALFVWTISGTTSWTRDVELSFCVTFGICLLAEIARLDVAAAEQRKNSFISSISYELRSPLHGILASTELLGQTKRDVFQKSLVDAIGSCGRTLLDTINHVLDFTKISSPGEQSLEVRPESVTSLNKSHPLPGSSRTVHFDSMIGDSCAISSSINVAAVCEEVVEGLFMGKLFQEVSSPAADWTMLNTSPKSSFPAPHNDKITLEDEATAVDNGDDTVDAVEILLDIEKENWQLATQPGALRRVIMNLVGNAIKYTERGWVKVKLELHDPSKHLLLSETRCSDEDRCIIILTIKDSGRGISPEYLRTHLYTAFSQEDILSPGTGLGLSLVRSIVSMLQGTIDIRSRLGQGTEVTVRLPMRRPRQEMETPRPPPAVGGDPPYHPTDSISALQELSSGKTIALFGFDSAARNPSASGSIGDSIAYYVSEWYGLTTVSLWESSSQCDILIADEVDMPALLAHGPKFPGSIAGPLLVILCSNAVRYGQTSVYASGGGIIEFVTKPLGPYKLARALHHCLQRAVEARPDLEDGATPSSSNIKHPPIKECGSQPQLAPGREIEDSSVRTMTVREAHSEPDEDTIASVAHPITASEMQIHKSTSGCRILLVDDNAINLRLLAMFMKRRQYTDVATAANGQLAVEAVEQSDGFDIIFMDISMPVLNGFEATRAIRDIEAQRLHFNANVTLGRSQSAVVALTGLASARDRLKALAVGIDWYITKPFSFQELGELLDRWELQGKDAFRSSSTQLLTEDIL